MMLCSSLWIQAEDYEAGELAMDDAITKLDACRSTGYQCPDVNQCLNCGGCEFQRRHDGRQNLALVKYSIPRRLSEHAILVQRAARWLKNTRRCAVVLVEPVAFQAREIPDAIGFLPGGYSIVVECKANRADFLKDKKKRHRVLDRLDCGVPGMGHERWYFAQPNIRPAPELAVLIACLRWGDLPWRQTTT